MVVRGKNMGDVKVENRAAVLNLLTGWAYLKLYPRMKKKRASGAAYLAAGALILILGVVSAISIWGGL